MLPESNWIISIQSCVDTNNIKVCRCCKATCISSDLWNADLGVIYSELIYPKWSSPNFEKKKKVIHIPSFLHHVTRQ